MRLTPLRVGLPVGVLLALGYIAFAILQVDDSAQIPMVTTGLTAVAVLSAAISVLCAISMWRMWQRGAQGSTVLLALIGGLAGMAALGAFGGAIVLALVWGS